MIESIVLFLGGILTGVFFEMILMRQVRKQTEKRFEDRAQRDILSATLFKLEILSVHEFWEFHRDNRGEK